jgi:hypothetical protein
VKHFFLFLVNGNLCCNQRFKSTITDDYYSAIPQMEVEYVINIQYSVPGRRAI